MDIDQKSLDNWLPSFPAVAAQVLDLFSREDVAITELAGAIEADPMLTASVLQMANSAKYRTKSEITTLAHAVSWLGKSEVTGLVLSFKLNEFSAKNEEIQESFDDYWRTSFVQAQAMKRIAEVCSQINGNEAFVAGLLMDLGKLMLLDTYPSEYTNILTQSQSERTPIDLLEKAKLGISHGELGAQLLEKMSLPKIFCEVAVGHTLPPADIDAKFDDSMTTLIKAASMASAAADFFCGPNQIEALESIEAIGRDHLNLAASDMEWFLESLRVDVEEKAELFKVNLDGMAPVSELVGRAREQSTVSNDTASSDQLDAAELQRILQENERLKETVRSLETRVCIDSLTQIYNRDYFQGRFEEKVHNCVTGSGSVGLLVMDIDKFKFINDNYGHLAGDCAISMTAKIIDDFFGDEAVVARYGGDEFVVLVEVDNARELTERSLELCKKVEAETPELTGQEKPVTTSIGGVVCRVDKPRPSLDTIIFKVADEALYESKKRGGNTATITEWSCRESAPNAAIPTDTEPTLSTTPGIT